MEQVLNRFMAPQETHDTELVRRMASGNEDALRRLYADYGRRMYAYALRLTGDPATAEDVLQESLVAAWQGACRYRGDGRVLTWLLGIVHHKATSVMRHRGRTVAREVRLDASGGEALDAHMVRDETPTPDEQVLLREQSNLLARGMDELSAEHRAVLDLVFYHGLKLSEVAEVCRCPVGTVKSRLSYARNRLRGILSRRGLGAEDAP
jgi:RNA polymerase sigma-70 factor (ECF subfamily)